MALSVREKLPLFYFQNRILVEHCSKIIDLFFLADVSLTSLSLKAVNCAYCFNERYLEAFNALQPYCAKGFPDKGIIRI